MYADERLMVDLISPIIVKLTRIPLTCPYVLRGERRFEKPLRREVGRPGFEESTGAGGPGRKEYARADSDNWRTLREEQDEDDGETGNSWRISGPRRDGTRQVNIIALSVKLPIRELHLCFPLYIAHLIFITFFYSKKLQKIYFF